MHLKVNGLKPDVYDYELWCVRDDGWKVSAGTFRVDAAGEAEVRLTTSAKPTQYDALAIQARPAGRRVPLARPARDGRDGSGHEPRRGGPMKGKLSIAHGRTGARRARGAPAAAATTKAAAPAARTTRRPQTTTEAATTETETTETDDRDRHRRHAEEASGGGEATALQISADPDGALTFDKTSLEAPAGPVEIVDGNPSTLPHAVEIEGQGGARRDRQPGRQSTATADLQAGEYRSTARSPATVRRAWRAR